MPKTTPLEAQFESLKDRRIAVMGNCSKAAATAEALFQRGIEVRQGVVGKSSNTSMDAHRQLEEARQTSGGHAPLLFIDQAAIWAQTIIVVIDPDNPKLLDIAMESIKRCFVEKTCFTASTGRDMQATMQLDDEVQWIELKGCWNGGGNPNAVPWSRAGQVTMTTARELARLIKHLS